MDPAPNALISDKWQRRQAEHPPKKVEESPHPHVLTCGHLHQSTHSCYTSVYEVLRRGQRFCSRCLPGLPGSGVLKVELGLHSLQKPLKYLVLGMDRTLISYTVLGRSFRSRIVVLVFNKLTCWGENNIHCWMSKDMLLRSLDSL